MGVLVGLNMLLPTFIGLLQTSSRSWSFSALRREQWSKFTIDWTILMIVVRFAFEGSIDPLQAPASKLRLYLLSQLPHIIETENNNEPQLGSHSNTKQCREESAYSTSQTTTSKRLRSSSTIDSHTVDEDAGDWHHQRWYSVLNAGSLT